MFVLHDQQLLDVLFKPRHCYVDGLWSLLAMSVLKYYFLYMLTEHRIIILMTMIIMWAGKEDQPSFAANLYKQKGHQWSTRNGSKAYASELEECSLWIQMWFVRCKLYWLHLPSPPSACRGTQTSHYWQAFLGKTQLKTVLKKCRGKLECLIFEMLIIRNKRPTLNTQADSIRAKLFIYLLVCSIFTPQFNFTYSWHFSFFCILYNITSSC